MNCALNDVMNCDIRAFPKGEALFMEKTFYSDCKIS